MNGTFGFFAPGIPAPKGSTRSFVVKGKAITTATNAKTKPWQAVVACAAQDAGITPTDGPVELQLDFYFPRPRGHYGKKGLKPSSPFEMLVKPDLDKLVRSVLDALTGIAYKDDSRVHNIQASKHYAIEGERCGVSVGMQQTWSEP